MGAADKAKGAAKNVGGKVEEATGRVTGNEDLEQEGRFDQAEGEARSTEAERQSQVDDVEDDDRIY